jgi:pilus assembly protein CpaC
MKDRSLIRKCIIGSLAVVVLYIAFGSATAAAGPERVTVSSIRSEKLALTTGQSVILESQSLIKRITVAAPATVDAVVLTPRQVYLTGKAPGLTTVTLWTEGDRISAVFDAEVLPDVARLKGKLYEAFPKEKDIRVNATHESLTLAGSVSSASAMSQVLALAQAYAPLDKDGKQKIINLLEVGGVHQVMLEVRVAEVQRSLARRLGFNFAFLSDSAQQFGLSLLDNLTRLPSDGFPGNPLQVGDNINMVLRFLGGNASWTVFIDALKENGLLKVLAEPTLITLSGKSANFLAGGEFPIPVPQSSGAGGTTITIEYKTFGVGLNFTPTVLSSGKINMQVAPEVSDLDFTQAVALQGFIVPSLTTRRVSTTVELGDGQSFAIAGLLRDSVRESVRKFPLLGDIPILGTLFRSSDFQKSETELIVIVTPHLVKPLDVAKQPLPTDQFIEPDDLEFYLMGRLEGESKEKAPTVAGKTASVVPTRRAGGLDGDFGHIVP